MPINVKRKNVILTPDPQRVIARCYMPGYPDRTLSIVDKVLGLSERECEQTLTQVLRNFSARHRNITRIFEQSFDEIKWALREMGIDPASVAENRKLLIGSYFTMEYAIESTAFFNPSIVEDPYQEDLQEGEKRIIVSFRATGEGHVSSVVFRSGVIDRNNDLHLVKPGRYVDVPQIIKRHLYTKSSFLKKLDEMHIKKDIIGMVMNGLGESFTYGDLQESIERVKKNRELSFTRQKVLQAINWLASSHYEITFSRDTALSERVIFPVSATESNGIEDARFVRFTDKDGSVTYYATYTAYNGYTILPRLLETKDFYHFKVMPIHGECAQNKGLSLFPRKIGGRYAMLSRNDGVNNYVIFSNNINVWEDGEKIEEPLHPWEFVQIGNAGSPLETNAGWLLIMHGVGPMRRYCLSASLLDLEDPTKVLSRLHEPLLTPSENERDGYVPNVIYSCGSIILNGELIIPYGISDYASTFATLSLEELMQQLKRNAR